MSGTKPVSGRRPLITPTAQKKLVEDLARLKRLVEAEPQSSARAAN